MKRLIPLAALAIAPAFAFADILGDPANFDGLMDGATLFDVGEGEGKIEGVAANFGITLTVSEADGDHDSSSLVAYTDPASQTLATDATDATQQQNYVKLSTGNDQLTKRLGGSEDGFAGLAANDDHDLYIDTLMQFTARASAPDISGDTEAKFALYLDIEGKLHVLAGPVADGAPTDYATTLTVPEDDWVRLTVSVEKAAPARDTLAFQVRIDGALAETSENVSSFPSLITEGDDALTVKEVSFIGEGALDDFAVASLYPFEDNLKHWFEKGYGTENEPYSVPASASGLVALSDAVASLSTTDVHFSLAGDIDMTGAEAFPGIGTYNAGADGTSYFSGVFDGGDHKISNITFTDRDYAGLFNQVVGGTIKNLKMENASFVGTGTKFGGAFFVGNARPGSTLENLVAEGTLGSAEKPLNHNAAGIVCRANGDPSNPLNIVACTNKAAIYGSYTKVAGIAAILQKKNGTQGKGGIVFDTCSNEGAITKTGTAKNTDGLGGLVAYADDYVTFKDCTSTGVLSDEKESSNVGLFIGQMYQYTAASDGENKILWTLATPAVGSEFHGLNDDGNPVDGYADALAYALLPADADGCATLVAADALSLTAGNTYAIANGNYATDAEIVPEDGATLNFAIDKTLYPSTTLTLNVPSDVTVNIASASSIGGVTALKGEGRIVSDGDLGGAPETFSDLVANSEWTGTLVVKNKDLSSKGMLALTAFANAGSSVAMDKVTFFPKKESSDNNVKSLEIGEGGATLAGDHSEGTFTFPSALTGTGTLTINIVNSSAASQSTKNVHFTGDASKFAGGVAFGDDSNACLIFGTGYDTSDVAAKRVVQGNSSTLTVASGKTWSADDFMIHGDFAIEGSLSDRNGEDGAVGVVWNNKTTAVLRVKNPDGFRFGNLTNWRGTYVVCWNASGAVNPNNYGNAYSTVAFAADLAENAYFGTGSEGALNIAPEIRLDTDVAIKNGYSKSDDSCLVTFAKLSSSGDYALAFSTGYDSSATRRYAITKISDFSGSLTIPNHASVRIGAVDVAAKPEADAVVVKVSCTANGSIGGDLKLTVNGEEVGTLEYKSDATPTGLYLAASTPDAVVVNPGEAATTTYDTEEAATTAAAAVTIGVPEAVAAKLTTEQQAAYEALFEAVAVERDGTWKIEVALKPEVATAIQTAIDSTETMAELGAALKSASVSDEGGTAEIAATPGLYYVVDAGTQVTDLAPAVCELAESEKITLTLPKQSTSGFYQLRVEITPVEIPSAETRE